MEVCIICEVSNVKRIVRNEIPMLECETCGLVWKQHFDVAVSHYEENEIHVGKANLSRRVNNVQDRIARIEKYFVPNNLCDIGAGEGTFLRELSTRGYTNVIGIEPNREAVTFAQSQGVTVSEGTLADAPDVIRRHNVHAVTLFHVIEHLDDPKGALKKLYSSLGPGDHLVIETPDAEAYSVVRAQYRHPLVYQEHLFYFNTKNLVLLLERVGFTIQAQGKRGFDQYNMSIRQALFYLGMGKPPFISSGREKHEQEEAAETNIKKTSMVRTAIRKSLSLLVTILGRVDYQWVIAEK